MKKFLGLFLAGIMAFGSPASAIYTNTFSPQNGDKIYIAPFNVEFSAIASWFSSLANGGITSSYYANLSITNAAISSSAAIAYSKLSLASSIVTGDIVDGTLVNADVSTSAEIAMSKLTTSASDATLAAAMENFMDGMWCYRSSSTVVGVTIGSIMINGKLRRVTSALTNTYSAPSNGDWLDIWVLADSAASTCTLSTVGSGATPGGSANPGTNGRMIGSIHYVDGTSKIVDVINYRPNEVDLWTFKVGSNTQSMTISIAYGVTFKTVPIPVATPIGYAGSAPTDLTSFSTGQVDAESVKPYGHSTTGCTLQISTENGDTLANTRYYAYSLVCKGNYA